MCVRVRACVSVCVCVFLSCFLYWIILQIFLLEVYYSINQFCHTISQIKPVSFIVGLTFITANKVYFVDTPLTLT